MGFDATGGNDGEAGVVREVVRVGSRQGGVGQLIVCPLRNALSFVLGLWRPRLLLLLLVLLLLLLGACGAEA